MQVGHFPAPAVNSLIQGYCDDFVSLAAILAQTLEQVSMRGLNFDGSRPALQRIENGMRNLAEAIHELMERGKVAPDLCATLDQSKAPAKGSTEPQPLITKPSAMSVSASTSAASTSAASTSAASTSAATKPARTTTRIAPAPTPATVGAANTGPRPAAAPAPVTAPKATATHSASTRSVTAPTRPLTNTAARPQNASQAAENLRGTSQSMPLLSVFQFLGRMRKAGTMHVHTANEQMAFDLQNGSIVFTASNSCPRHERIGELLVERGACTREQLEILLQKVDADAPERFGQLAMDEGIVTEKQVVQAIELQVNRRFARACKSPDCSYEFVAGARQAEGRFRIEPVVIG